MKGIRILRYLVLLLMISSLLFSGCASENTEGEGQEQVEVQTYTCPMHPQIISNKPGTCPVCSMDLVPFDKSSVGAALTIDATRQALANITTIIIGTDALTNSKQLNGRLVVNPDQTNFVSSRVAGRIEQLFVRELGVSIAKGQPLYKIYSEQLAILQNEYLLAVELAKQFPKDEKYKQIEQAAKQKLKLYSQSDTQIQTLVRNKKADPLVIFYASDNGVLAELSIVEGQYVEEGSPVLRLESYSNLWVEADIYPSEISLVKIGEEVKVVIPGWEDQPQFMKVQFITPSLQAGSQLMQIRGTLSNSNKEWQAGLQVNLFLPMKSEGNVLSLPVDAVIRTGTGTHVWIETEKDTFEARVVETGLENFDHVEIVKGISSGDKVVVTGAYLLYSEYVLKRGNDPMQGHSH